MGPSRALEMPFVALYLLHGSVLDASVWFLGFNRADDFSRVHFSKNYS